VYNTHSSALNYSPQDQGGRAASGGASAPEPPRATGVGPLSDGFFSFFSFLSLGSGRNCARSSYS